MTRQYLLLLNRSIHYYLSLCASRESSINNQNVRQKCQIVTREPRAGFRDRVEYEANEVNTPARQNTSYLAFIHENVAKQMKLWNV